MEKTAIHTENIKLDQFLKLSGAVLTGGETKLLIAEGAVFVNGRPETARRRKLSAGDVVTVRTEEGEKEFLVYKEA